MEIRETALTQLVPYVNNARTHSEAQVAEIAASIREFGFTNPILVDGENGIIAGHGRLQAARVLGMQTVPTIELAGLSDAQKRAYILADNRLALNAGWDQELLALELTELKELDVDLGLLGFSDDELAAAFNRGNEGLTDADDTPDLQEHAITEPGDVWVMGRHRLACGDSTDADIVALCMGGVTPHLMVTDPPYGVEYDASWRSAPGSAGPNSEGCKRNKGAAHGAVENDDRADWSEAWALFPGDVAYVWHAGVHSPAVAGSLTRCGFGMRALIVWTKNNIVIGRGDYHHMHEPCWYAVRKGKTGHWQGDRKQATVWKIDKPMKSETGHSTQKPVECMRRPIVNNSSPGQAVYEPFSGSGTTLIACEQEGRACLAIELNPQYVDVAVRRWEAFTGQAAVLERTGQTFQELENVRTTTDTDRAADSAGKSEQEAAA